MAHTATGSKARWAPQARRKACMGWSWAAACSVRGWRHIVAASRLELVIIVFCCVPVSSMPPGSICVLLFVISWRYRLTASARMVVELSQLPARRRGTHYQHTFVAWRMAPLHLDDYLRLICFLSTSVYSALGVSAIMRYMNRRFTYSLTYLLTYLLTEEEVA